MCAVQNARAHSFETETALRIYTQICISCGINFASDPRHTWSQPHLTEVETRGEGDRAMGLQAGAAKYIQATYGPKGQSLHRAIIAMQACNPDRFPTVLDTLIPDLHHLLHEMAPDIYQKTGPAALDVVMRSTVEDMHARHASGSAAALGRPALMAVFFGSGFDRDPFLVWLHKPLHKEALPIEERVWAMERRLRTWVKAILEKH